MRPPCSSARSSARRVAAILGLVLAWSLGRAVNDLHGGVNRLSLGDFSTRIRPRG